jgi:hypothetical protein
MVIANKSIVCCESLRSDPQHLGADFLTEDSFQRRRVFWVGQATSPVVCVSHSQLIHTRLGKSEAIQLSKRTIQTKYQYSDNTQSQQTHR